MQFAYLSSFRSRFYVFISSSIAKKVKYKPWTQCALLFITLINVKEQDWITGLTKLRNQCLSWSSRSCSNICSNSLLQLQDFITCYIYLQYSKLFFFLSSFVSTCSGTIVKARDKLYHPDCFICDDCGINLKQRGYFFIEDNLYCETHAKARVQPPEGYDVVAVYPNSKVELVWDKRGGAIL